MKKGTYINFKVEGRRYRALFHPLTDSFSKIEISSKFYFTEIKQNEWTEDIVNKMLYALSVHPQRDNWCKMFWR